MSTRVMAGAAVVAALLLGGTAAVPERADASDRAGNAAGSPDGSCVSDAVSGVDAAVAFLDERVAADAGVGVPGIPRSYVGGHLGAIGFTSSFVYDDALVILASLARGTAADVQRARQVGDALVYAQDRDAAGDGRVRNSYQPDPFVRQDGSVVVGSHASSTGNQAWAGLAWVRLFQATGEHRYLDAAHRIGLWIHATQYSDEGIPGYRGGIDESGSAVRWKASEHNIDVAAFFRALGTATGQADWTVRADVAETFLHGMRSAAGFFYTGVQEDGATVNRHPVPLDVQAWAFLLTRRAADGHGLDWAADALAATDRGISGVSVSTADTSTVWLEGTAQLALAFGTRAGGSGADAATSAALLDAVWMAQACAPHADGRGIVAASSDGLDSGFGGVLYASLHTGATAWAILAALGVNPLAPSAP